MDGMALVWVHPNSVYYRPLSVDLAEPPTSTTTTHSHKSLNVDIQRDWLNKVYRPENPPALN